MSGDAFPAAALPGAQTEDRRIGVVGRLDMISRRVREALTTQERRFVRTWTWATAAFYASLVLIIVALASFAHRPAGNATGLGRLSVSAQFANVLCADSASLSGAGVDEFANCKDAIRAAPRHLPTSA